MSDFFDPTPGAETLQPSPTCWIFALASLKDRFFIDALNCSCREQRQKNGATRRQPKLTDTSEKKPAPKLCYCLWASYLCFMSAFCIILQAFLKTKCAECAGSCGLAKKYKETMAVSWNNLEPAAKSVKEGIWTGQNTAPKDRHHYHKDAGTWWNVKIEMLSGWLPVSHSTRFIVIKVSSPLWKSTGWWWFALSCIIFIINIFLSYSLP